MKTRIATILALVALALTACGSSNEGTGNTSPAGETSNEIVEIQHTMKDGRTVTCLYYNGFKEATMSCDWNNAK